MGLELTEDRLRIHRQPGLVMAKDYKSSYLGHLTGTEDR